MADSTTIRAYVRELRGEVTDEDRRRAEVALAALPPLWRHAVIGVIAELTLDELTAGSNG